VGKGNRVSAAPLSPFSAAEIVNHYAARTDLDPASFAVRSLRAGFPIRAAEHGASVFKMMGVSRHRSVDRCAVTFAGPTASEHRRRRRLGYGLRPPQTHQWRPSWPDRLHARRRSFML
jgi:hypothetical protein